MASKRDMFIWYQFERKRNSNYRRLVRQSYWNELCIGKRGNPYF
ncbi:hypothetical protein [Brenneria goodwinii]